MVRVGDFLIAVVLIALTLPLMVIVAIANKLGSPGLRSFSKREKWGTQGHKFPCLVSAPKTHPLRGPIDCQNQPPEPTLIGAFLSWTRIDTLPQLDQWPAWGPDDRWHGERRSAFVD